MARFHLCAFDPYNAQGGMWDYIQSFDYLEEAQAFPVEQSIKQIATELGGNLVVVLTWRPDIQRWVESPAFYAMKGAVTHGTERTEGPEDW